MQKIQIKEINLRKVWMTKNYGTKNKGSGKKNPGKPKNPHHETAKLLPQCPRADLNKKFLPRPKTTTV